MAGGFSETVLGKLLIGTALAVISALIGGVVAWMSIKDEPPVVSISPKEITVAALEPTIFSAEASHDPEGADLTFAWSLNGQPFGSSPVAVCSETPKPSVVSCRFSMSGTHAVTVAGKDPSSLVSSAAATVQVKLENGYLGLVINVGDMITQSAIETAILYGVDWGEVQTLVGRPIILNDPILKTSVYAALYGRDLEAAKSALSVTSIAGIKVGSFGLRQEAQDIIQLQAAEAGLHISFFSMPANEVMSGIQAGIGEGGFLAISSPAELQSLNP